MFLDIVSIGYEVNKKTILTNIRHSHAEQQASLCVKHIRDLCQLLLATYCRP